MTVDYDWADDESLSAEETMRIFEALGPDELEVPECPSEDM